MSSYWNNWLIGKVSTGPGTWLLQETSATLGEITTAGYPLPKGVSAGDLVFCTYPDSNGAPASIVLSASIVDGVLVLVDISVPEGNASPYTTAFWLSNDGLDIGAVNNIDQPAKTLDYIIAKIAALPDPTVPCVINCVDASNFISGTSGYTFPTNSNVFLNAPGAIFSTPGTIGLFRGTGGAFKACAAQLAAPSQRILTWGGSASLFLYPLLVDGNINNDSGDGANLTVDTSFIHGDYISSTNLANEVRAKQISGDVTETSAGGSLYRFGLFAGSVGGDISSTNSAIYGNVSSVGGSVSGIRQGIFNGVMYGVSVPGPFTIGEYTLPATDGTIGQVITTDGTGDATWEDVPTP